MAGDVAARLKAVPLLSGLSTRELERLAGAMRERTVAAGDVIVSEGEGGAGFFVIDSGEASVTRRGAEIGTLSAGDTFGEISLIDRKPRSATITATSECVCRGMTPWEFRPLVEENPSMAWALLETMVERVRSAEERESS